MRVVTDLGCAPRTADRGLLEKGRAVERCRALTGASAKPQAISAQ